MQMIIAGTLTAPCPAMRNSCGDTPSLDCLHVHAEQYVLSVVRRFWVRSPTVRALSDQRILVGHQLAKLNSDPASRHASCGQFLCSPSACTGPFEWACVNHGSSAHASRFTCAA